MAERKNITDPGYQTGSQCSALGYRRERKLPMTSTFFTNTAVFSAFTSGSQYNLNSFFSQKYHFIKGEMPFVIKIFLPDYDLPHVLDAYLIRYVTFDLT